MDQIIDPKSSPEEQFLQREYLETLSQKEKQSVLIAASHLGMSFQLKKSVGYLKWRDLRLTSKL